MRITDRQLTTASLAISAMGIAALIMLSMISGEVTDVGSALGMPDQEEVSVLANITSVRNAGNTTFLTLEGTCTLEAVVFEALDITTPHEAIITGTMSTYNGKRELVASSITTP